MALRGVLDQFLDTFKRFSLLQRVSLLAATVAVFVSVIALVWWANKTPYKTLYSDLPDHDVKEISAALDSKRIPYKVLDGKNIEISSEDVYATRIALALEGLPRDQGVGFELFDDSKLGMTEFHQNVNYQRALQGELARSISSINGVVDSKVHLFVPKDRLFAGEDDESKASVVIRLLPGFTLKPDQVKAISHLVSSAVKGLKPDSVQILDTNGNLLSEFLNESHDSIYVSQTQLEQQRKIEKELEKKLQSQLSKILGMDRYVAKVSVELDFSKREVTKEEFGETPVLRSQHNLEINSKNSGKKPEGIPGVESNLAEPDLLIADILSEYTKTEETQNFEINKIITREQKNSGEIRRLTVSVVVDDKPEYEVKDGVKTLIKRARTDEELAKIRNAVSAAVGYSKDRGDIVDITNISFDTAAAEIDSEVLDKEKWMDVTYGFAKYILALLILILFYFLLIRPLLKRLDNAKDFDETLLGGSAMDAQLSSLDITIGGESGFPKSVEELEREIESELSESVPVDVEAVKSKVMLKKIEETANEDPELIANLIKALIKGG